MEARGYAALMIMAVALVGCSTAADVPEDELRRSAGEVVTLRSDNVAPVSTEYLPALHERHMSALHVDELQSSDGLAEDGRHG